MAQETRRISGLDLMKALGLYMVVLYHLTFRHAQEALTDGVRGALLYLPASLLSICVPLFFTAGGALSLTRPLDLKRNTLRALHLAVLTVIWTVASLAVVLALRGERPGLRTFFSIAWNLQVGYIQHLWYLPVYLFLTLLTPILYSLRTGPARIYRYGLLLLGTLTFGNMLLSDGEHLLRWATGHLGHMGERQFFGYGNMFASYWWYTPIYLALGAFLLENRTALRRRRRQAIAVIAVCLGMLTLCGLARTHMRGMAYDPVCNNYGDFFTLGLTAAVSLLLIDCRPGERLARAVASMADCSLGIYLIHWLLIEALLDFLPASLDSLALAPLLAVPVLALSWALTWALRQIPGVRDLLTASPAWIKTF